MQRERQTQPTPATTTSDDSPFEHLLSRPARLSARANRYHGAVAEVFHARDSKGDVR